MPASRPGWNKGSQYGVEWLTGKTKDRSERSATSQPPANAEQAAGKTCARPGFNQHNQLEHMLNYRAKGDLGRISESAGTA